MFLLCSQQALGNEKFDIINQPHTVGEIVNLEGLKLRPGTAPQKLNLFRDGSGEWAKILLKPEHTGQEDDTREWKVRITDSGGYEIEHINGIGLKKTKYTSALTTSPVFLSVPKDGTAVTVIGIIQSKGTASLESIYGIKNIRELFNEPEVIQSARRGIVLIEFKKDGEVRRCNGFLLSKFLVATNEHCIDNDNIINDNHYPRAIFDFQDNIKYGQEIRIVDRIKGIDYDLDLALLKLEEIPKNVESRILSLSPDEDLTKEFSLRLVQHYEPENWKILSSYDGDCRILVSSVEGRRSSPTSKSNLGHGCDSAIGSSGTPLLRTRDAAVVGLHHWGIVPTVWEYNKALRGKMLINEVNRLAKQYPTDFYGLSIINH